MDRDETIFDPCEECDENFKHSENLLNHKVTHTQEQTKDEIQKTKNNRLCNICNKIFQRPYHQRKHMEKWHSIKADILDFIIKCRRCDDIFQAYKDLKTHLHIAHTEEGTKCNICDRLMFSREGMKKHLQTHQSDINVNIVRLFLNLILF